MRNWVNFWRVRGQKTESQKFDELMAAIDCSRLPGHIAIIMDGNGRWATRRGLPRAMGHRAGVESLREIVNISSALGIGFLTVYAFSTENWKRPKEEVNILMELLVEYLKKEIGELHGKNVRVRAIGRISELPEKAVQALADAEQKTRNNTGLTLNLALNYGGRTEITEAVRMIAEMVSSGRLDPAQVNEELVAGCLYTGDMPDPDLLIRPSGEQRISNFLLWQAAYAEFWYCPELWPDFRKVHLLQAVLDYQNRQRRFGGLKN
jgi:undecaprenyl diphosphate synthase